MGDTVPLPENILGQNDPYTEFRTFIEHRTKLNIGVATRLCRRDTPSKDLPSCLSSWSGPTYKRSPRLISVICLHASPLEPRHAPWRAAPLPVAFAVVVISAFVVSAVVLTSALGVFSRH